MFTYTGLFYFYSVIECRFLLSGGKHLRHILSTSSWYLTICILPLSSYERLNTSFGTAYLNIHFYLFPAYNYMTKILNTCIHICQYLWSLLNLIVIEYIIYSFIFCFLCYRKLRFGLWFDQQCLFGTMHTRYVLGWDGKCRVMRLFNGICLNQAISHFPLGPRHVNKCSAGSFSPALGSIACNPCSAGLYSAIGAHACLLCDAGLYGNTAGLTSASCTAVCPVGYDLLYEYV